MLYSIVTAYHGKEELTEDFLNNLKDKITEDTEVILVSSGNEKERTFNVPYNIKYVYLSENKSFSNAMNAGIKEASGEYVIIIGNDGFPVDYNWLDLLRYGIEDTGAWIISPTADNPDYHVYDKLSLEKKGCYELYKRYPAICWMLPREVISKVGLFDEQFLIGCYEDDDYCLRVRAAGGSIWRTDKVKIRHLLSQTISSFDIHKSMEDNMKRFSEKWPGAL